MLFKYKGVDQNGKSVKGTLSANNIEEAKHKLRTRSIFYHSLAPTHKISLDSFSGQQMPGPVLSNFSRELSSYLNSGMAILTAIKLLENQHRKEKRYSDFLDAVKTRIEEGQSLFNALGSQKVYRLPEFFLQSINVAGQSGRLVEVLINMGNFFSAQSKIRKQVGNAIAYPLFIFIVAIGMSGFLITFVVPKITAIFRDTGQELPPITRFVLGTSDFLLAHYIAILLVLISFTVAFKLLYAKSRFFKKAIDTLMLKLPIVGILIQNYELGRFSYILSLTLGSGVSYAQGVGLAVSTFSNSALRERFDNAAQKVIEGNKLSNALQLTRGVSIKRNFMQALAL